MPKRYVVLLALCLMMVVSPVMAQQSENVANNMIEPTVVTAEAPDGLVLEGDFYLVDANHPTVLLLHQLYTTRKSWQIVIDDLLGSGFNVLAVDVRGYGKTRGGINWQKAVADVQVWLNWLRDSGGVRGDAISTMGSSMGSTLALLGCAHDLACRTAIALSPGWNYYNITLEEAFANQFGARQVMLVYAQRDRWPALGMPTILESATNEVTALEYPGNTHGMNLFRTEGDTLIPIIIDWLNRHGS